MNLPAKGGFNGNYKSQNSKHKFRVCLLTCVSELESSSSRLVNFEKCEFTLVNDHFEKEHNAEIGLYRQTIFCVRLDSF